MLRALGVSASAIGLTAVLLAAPALAGHKPNHNAGGGGGGGDATYEITLTDISNVVVASGDGVEGAGSTIEGTQVEPGSFETIKLGSISTQGGTSSVQDDFNSDPKCVGVTSVGPEETIDSIRIVPNPEIGELHVVVNYSIGNESFVLLLVGDLLPFPPQAAMDYRLTVWGNRGGGKGKNNRCTIGAQNLDGVTLTVRPN